MPASTEKQARTAKLALAFKKGELHADEVSDSVKEMSKMSEKQLYDYMKVEESEKTNSERNKKEEAIENKIDFISKIIFEPNSQETYQARSEVKNYLEIMKQEFKKIINAWFQSDPTVGLSANKIEDLEDDDISELNNDIDRFFAKYDLAKHMINLDENTSTACIAVIDAPQGMVKRKEDNKNNIVSSANQLEKEGTILKESEGGAFKYSYKLDKYWFENFKKNNPTYEYFYDKEEYLYLIYDKNDHIITYNTITNNVFTDKTIEEVGGSQFLREFQEKLKGKIEEMFGKKIVLI